MGTIIPLISKSEESTIVVSFEGLSGEEFYIEKSKIVNNDRFLSIKNEIENGNTQFATENSRDGGFTFSINNKHLFLNYAEMLDMYVLLSRIYQKDEPISKITTK